MANALESASLVMIPSGYEDGTLGSLKPTDGTGDFTFSRGSDISATRVNADGYIEKGYENLLLQSNTFSDAAWSSSNFTLTPNQSGYDGSNDAWKAQVSTTYNSLSQNFGGSGVYTFSGYFRKGDSNEGIRFNFSASTDTNVYVDLTDGSSTFNGTLIERSITDVGNGFYKVVVTANLTNPNSVRIFVTNGGTTMIAGSIYIQDAMLNQGLVAYPYKETTTAPVAGGILEDMPRLDYSNGSCPALLLEPSRTNLIPQSEYYDVSSWNKTRVTLTTNATTSPEGVINASLIIPTASSGDHLLRDDNTINSIIVGQKYTLSAFAKQAGYKYYRLYTSQSNTRTTFDLSTGTMVDNTGDDYSITDMGNGWYRLTHTFTATATFERFRTMVLNNDNSVVYEGDGTSGIYVYGHQFEQGTYPTSYIPTYGVSQTRLKDNVSTLAGLDSLNNEATIMAEFKVDSTGSGYVFQSSGASSYANISQYTQERLRTIVRFEGVNQFVAVVSNKVYPDTWYKIILRYSTNKADVFLNGENIISRTGTWTLEPLDNLTWSFTEGNETKQLLVFPTALTDSECIELTTI